MATESEGSTSRQRFDRREVGDLDQALAEPQQPGVLPDLQLLVDALPRGADDSGELLLRQAQGYRIGAGARGAARQPHQRLRHAVLQPPVHRLLDVPVGLAQALAQDFHQQDAQFGTTFEKRHEIAMIEDQEVAVGRRGGVRGAVLPVDQRDFAEHLAGVEQGQHDVMAGGRRRADPDAAGEDRHHAAAGRPLGEDLAAGRIMFDPGMRQERVERVGRQLAEEGMALEDSALLARRRSQHVLTSRDNCPAALNLRYLRAPVKAALGQWARGRGAHRLASAATIRDGRLKIAEVRQGIRPAASRGGRSDRTA